MKLGAKAKDAKDMAGAAERCAAAAAAARTDRDRLNARLALREHPARPAKAPGGRGDAAGTAGGRTTQRRQREPSMTATARSAPTS